MTAALVPVLPDAETVPAADVAAFAADVSKWRDYVLALPATQRGDEAVDGWRKLTAVERYVQDAAARRAAQAETRRTEILIGDLLGPAGIPGRHNGSSETFRGSLDDQYIAAFRFFAAHRPLAEQFIDNAVTRRKPLIKAIEDALAKPPPPGSARVELADWREWIPQQPECDLLFTDPPYMTDVEDVAAFALDWLPLALERVKPTGRAYVCIGAYPQELHAYLSVLMPAQVLVWSYRNTIGPSSPNRYSLNWQAILYYCGPQAAPLCSRSLSDRFAAQQINAPDGRFGEGRYHAWQKPMDLAKKIVELAVGQGSEAVVFDPFAGTGTHLLAAAETGNVGIGCEIDPDMIEIAQSRGVGIA